MAKAPKPRAATDKPRNAPPEAGRFVIRFRDTTLEMPEAITLKEKMAVRYATGMPFEAFWSGESRIGEDSISVLWWLARRHNGEPHLSFEQHAAEWPTELTADDFDVEMVTDDDEPTDDPEGSGPG